jgi:hypothetical protein
MAETDKGAEHVVIPKRFAIRSYQFLNLFRVFYNTGLWMCFILHVGATCLMGDSQGARGPDGRGAAWGAACGRCVI